MKKLFIGLFVIVAILPTLVGCDADRTVYNDSDYVMFSDTLYNYPVQDNEDYFNVPVAAGQAFDYDRTFGVEIIDKGSNAIEGRHYKLESNSIVIKAGERTADVKVKGIYENIGILDSLGFVMRLVSPKDTHWDIYGTETKVVMQKSCPFDIHNFEGYCTLSSSYFIEYSNVSMRLIKSEIDPDNENTIILKNFFYEGYDIKLKFNPEDPLKPFVRMDEQVFASTADAFGTLYGDGNILIYQPTIYTSYFNTCQEYVLQYMTLYVADVDTVGTFMNIIEWISDDEAEKLMREGF